MKKFLVLLIGIMGIFLDGCASTSKETDSAGSASTGQFASRYKATDGRTVDIGHNSAMNNGVGFKNPHMDKCWLAQGFNFSGYDTLYIAPTLSTAKLHNAEEEQPHQLAKQQFPIQMEQFLRDRGVFANVVTRETDVKPGSRVLKMENTILEYAKGGGAARYFAGLYGAGQPILRVQGKITDGDKVVFLYEARRSGVSAGSRTVGAFMKDTDIQTEDIRSMTLDLADFMTAVSGKFAAK